MAQLLYIALSCAGQCFQSAEDKVFLKEISQVEADRMKLSGGEVMQ